MNEGNGIGPQVTKLSMLAIQVCVSEHWTDYQATVFAESEYPCGTEHGWQIRKQGDVSLAGADERVACRGRHGYVHIMLDA